MKPSYNFPKSWRLRQVPGYSTQPCAEKTSTDFMKNLTPSLQSPRPHSVKLFIWLLICMLHNLKNSKVVSEMAQRVKDVCRPKFDPPGATQWKERTDS